MKTKEKNFVLDAIESDSFEYAFVHYSHFEEIKDNDFHKLREEYLEARNSLADYIGYED